MLRQLRLGEKNGLLIKNKFVVGIPGGEGVLKKEGLTYFTLTLSNVIFLCVFC